MKIKLKIINGKWTLNGVPYKLLQGFEKYIFERLLSEKLLSCK